MTFEKETKEFLETIDKATDPRLTLKQRVVAYNRAKEIRRIFVDKKVEICLDATIAKKC